MTLSGKTAVVTGGGTGIGQAIAIRLAKDGASVAVWGRTRKTLDETVNKIETAGGKALACVADCTDRTQIDRALEMTHQAFGPVTILINNAGAAEFCDFLDLTEEAFERLMRINATGPFHCTQATIPDMLKTGWGRIVSITSSITQDGIGGLPHYAASKSALVGLTKALAMEYADKNITANHVPVFFVTTAMSEDMPLDQDQISAMAPAKRAGRPEEVAAACAFLASEEASYVNGQALSTNGGKYLV